MKSFMKEFKEFISRGNVMDMAVGIIIGGAFTAIVSSLVEDIINPLLGCFVSMDFSAWKIPLVGDASLGIGNFINAVISFLPEAAPTTKICPYCKSEISIEATRCPHCTSQL